MPNTKQISMEDMSIAYLQALCAVNGYSLEEVKHDNYGVDCHVQCSGYPSENCSLCCPSINVQLKSSYSQVREENGFIVYNLEVKNYKDLIKTDRFVPTILVLLHMYEEKDRWLSHTPEQLIIRKCAYWVSLKGKEDTDNTQSITIRIPIANLLTPSSLKELMIKISKGQEL